jgi:2-polyprenyl-3-methyl-5-hydroxy-6-metoxy-1,4-benzoquinol methylase
LRNPFEEIAVYDDYFTNVDFEVEDYKRGSKSKNLSEIYIINEQRIEYIKKVKQSGEVLDVGSGLGFFLKTAQENGYTVHGIDISERAVQLSRDVFNVASDVETPEDLIKQGKKFDIITLWHVLEHFINPFDELNKIKQLLKDNGICIIEVPNLLSLKFILSRKKWKGGNHPLYHRTFFTSKTLKKALLQSGFSTAKRICLSYKTDQRNVLYFGFKLMLNAIAMDSNINFITKL